MSTQKLPIVAKFLLATPRKFGRLYDEEQRNSCISDEELRAYVEKYFFFRSILEKETYRIVENGPLHENGPSAITVSETLEDRSVQADADHTFS